MLSRSTVTVCGSVAVVGDKMILLFADLAISGIVVFALFLL